MSRIWGATQHFMRGVRIHSVFLNTLRKLTTAPKCPPAPPKKPKPGYFPSGGTHAVFSDLPKPEGDFYQAWHAKNTKYNLVLLSGLVAAIGAIGASSQYIRYYFIVPDYPYTEDELKALEEEQEHERQEMEAKEERHVEAVQSRELSIRRRKAKDAMAREVALMQKDIDDGIDDQELAELQQLVEQREDFEKWELEEEKRLKLLNDQMEKERKEKEKLKAKK